MYRSICEALEGSSLSAYEVFGAHPDDNGVRFTVYAPNAVSVAVIGDFNGWSYTQNPAWRRPDGLWPVCAPRQSRRRFVHPAGSSGEQWGTEREWRAGEY